MNLFVVNFTNCGEEIKTNRPKWGTRNLVEFVEYSDVSVIKV